MHLVLTHLINSAIISFWIMADCQTGFHFLLSVDAITY